jgi:periplasmic divalent cation tolerance protein
VADSTEIVVVYVTCPEKDAVRIAQSIVERSLAACANIVPTVRSIYRWQGKIVDEPESLLIVKTTRARFEALRAGVIEVHPYEVPEVIALPVVAGHAPYLGWVNEMSQEESS